MLCRIAWPLLLLSLLLVCGCGPAARTEGPIAVPPASAGVSAAKEDVIAQIGATLAKEYEAKAAAHDAATAAEREAAKHEITTAKAEGVALKAVLKHQDESEQQASVRWCLLAGVVLVALGVFLAYEGRLKVGTGLMLAGGSLSVGAMVLTALIPYELLMAKCGIVAGILALVWHFRAKLEEEAGKFRDALDHLHLGKDIHAAEGAVKAELQASYARIHGLTIGAVHVVEGMLHMGKKPVVTVTSSPASAPVVVVPGQIEAKA